MVDENVFRFKMELYHSQDRLDIRRGLRWYQCFELVDFDDMVTYTLSIGELYGDLELIDRARTNKKIKEIVRDDVKKVLS